MQIKLLQRKTSGMKLDAASTCSTAQRDFNMCWKDSALFYWPLKTDLLPHPPTPPTTFYKHKPGATSPTAKSFVISVLKALPSGLKAAFFFPFKPLPQSQILVWEKWTRQHFCILIRVHNRCCTSNWGQFMGMPGPWLALNHFRSSSASVAEIVSSSVW